jgi:hypothetical protein
MLGHTFATAYSSQRRKAELLLIDGLRSVRRISRQVKYTRPHAAAAAVTASAERSVVAVTMAAMQVRLSACA